MKASSAVEAGLVPACGLAVPAWVLAALGAAALHAGCALALAGALASSDQDVALGAPAIEVGIELASPKLEQSDLPPGPEAESSVATPAMPEQKAVVEETRFEKDKPVESEDPDRIVSPTATEKPKEEEVTKATVTTNASEESVASEAAAPPVVENAPEAERSVAPAQGTGDSAQRIKAAWQKELVAHINRQKRYPAGPARRNEEIVLSFTLDRVGRLVSVNVAKSSGDAAFDEAAVAMLRRSDPVPQPPARVADEGLTFSLPVIFRARNRPTG